LDLDPRGGGRNRTKPKRRERNPWTNEFVSIARVNYSQLRGELRKKRLHGTEADPPVALGGFVAGGKIGAAAAGKKKGAEASLALPTEVN
jgi:hypothetical protein